MPDNITIKATYHRGAKRTGDSIMFEITYDDERRIKTELYLIPITFFKAYGQLVDTFHKMPGLQIQIDSIWKEGETSSTTMTLDEPPMFECEESPF